MKKHLLFIIFILVFTAANAQMWGMYTLYSIKGSIKAFLIDTNNVVYKAWAFNPNAKTCFSTYLIPGDTLVRTVIYPGNVIDDGPTSGEVQKVDWNNNVVWDFVYSDSTHVLHHDICPLANGNVLMIALDVMSADQGTQAGGSASIIRHSDKILEVQPTGPTSGNIVWEWDLWDHLCQNYDSTKDNYVTSLVQNPQLIDINYNSSLDFFHMNGIDYNAALDQITFSSFALSEIYVIDHSTTTAEAAGHTGGNSGYGGDILYRWGNPAAYGATGTTYFNIVHDAHWVSADNPYFPNYLSGFNNTGGAGGNSAVDVISPPYNGYNYNLTTDSAYGPTIYSWLYTANSVNNNEGSTQQLPNGNSLVCMSLEDTIFEVNYSGATLWFFKTNGLTSKAYRYSKCYVRGPLASAGASSTNIVSGTPINLSSSATSITETNPTYTYLWTSIPIGFTSNIQNPSLSPDSTATYIVTVTDTALGCSYTASVTVNVGTNGINKLDKQNGVIVFPNPVKNNLQIQTNLLIKDIEITDITGKLLYTTINKTVNCSGLVKGVYFIRVITDKGVLVKKFIKD